jgi:hypothetical protein
MMGNEKASAIRQKLHAAFARERTNPIPALDRKIRALAKKGGRAEPELRSLRRLRRALAQVIETKPRKSTQPARANGGRKRATLS